MCRQKQIYEEFYGLLAEQICISQNIYAQKFEEPLKNPHESVKVIENGNTIIIAKFYAQLIIKKSII
jgi:hypothetical protein